MIEDRDIPSADPAELIEQYKLYIFKLANRYIPVLEQTGVVGIEDLHQVGFMAICKAQKAYDPERCSFITWLSYRARSDMRAALGFNSVTGAPPKQLTYLDEPIPGTDDNDLTLLDTIPDPDILPFDEPIIEDETRQETKQQVRDAVERMRSDKQRTAIELVWLEGKTRKQAADEMEMEYHSFTALEKNGRCTLRRDRRLRNYVQEMPFVHVSLARFNSTWTSSTEYAALKRLEHDPDYISRREAAAEQPKTERSWTPAQSLAYVNRLKKKRAAEKEATAE